MGKNCCLLEIKHQLVIESLTLTSKIQIRFYLLFYVVLISKVQFLLPTWI